MRLGKGAAAILAGLGLLAAGCDLDSMKLGVGGSTPPAALPAAPPAVSDLECRAKDGKIGLSWGAVSGAYAYRVSRSEPATSFVELGQATDPAYTDYGAIAGVAYQYTVTPIGVDGDGPASGPCTVSAPSSDGPPSPKELICRAKDGKVDVTWDAVAEASLYRVYRTGAGQPRTQVAETSGRVLADAALQNGFQYGYDVVAVDGRGRASAPSTPCQATPGPRQTGAAPPVVQDLACRGKNDKVDLTFTPAPGAAFHRVYRSDPGSAAVAVGETVGGVFAQFGLQIGTRYEFSIESVGPGGAASARSAVCAVTASDRVTGPANQPPTITSQPLTSALEDHVYYFSVLATDPEGGVVTYSLQQAPAGMSIDPESGYVQWTPGTSQIGPQAVEVRARDPQGAYDTQAFAVDVVDFDEPPTITSVPPRTARAGVAYQYRIEAFDPEGRPLTYAFAAVAPAGMTLDPATGVVAWTPQPADSGAPEIVVRAIDPAGQFDTQRYGLLVSADPLDLVAPTGERVVRPGETLRLELAANQAGAGFRVQPAPENATLQKAVFEFKPTVAQEGTYDLGFEAVLGEQRDVNVVRIRVERENGPPVFGALSAQTVAEGQTLRVVVTGTDPESDPLQFSAPGLSLPNAVFDELSSSFVFTPGFDQAGSYEVALAVSDGRSTTPGTLAITVEDAAPPVTQIDLAVDPPQTPTFRPMQTISGSIDGSTTGPVAGNAPLVVGLSPVSVRQGREVVVTVTGRDTAFVAGRVTADFGAGLTVQDIVVVSPTELRATVRAAADAGLGVRTVRVREEGDEAPSVVAFRVEPGAAVLSGLLVDDFTGQPLANARVTIQGSSVTGTTDAEGRFLLEGVPAGEQKLVVAVSNYAVRTLDLSVQANVDVDFDEALGLQALARPFSAGGSLPRAATLASVLDRGASEQEGDLTFEQARAVVMDTMLAIGGDEFGVVDEAGNQLNPEFSGPGMLSLGPRAVDLFAERLLLAETFTFGQIATMLEGSFGWLYPDLSFEALREQLQEGADAAWADPSDPLSVLPIVLLNPGRTLASRPPVVGQDTTFNAFQAFLYVSSFFISNARSMDAALDQLLIAQGIDPRAALISAGFDPDVLASAEKRPSFAESLASRAGAALGAAIAPSAHADPGSQEGGANQVSGKPRASRAGTVVSSFPNIILASLLAGIVAAAFTALLVLVGAATGGPVFGVTLAAIGTAFVSSFVSALFAKLLVAFVADPNAVTDLTPTPASIVSNASAKAAGQDKIMIPFQRAESDLKLSELLQEQEAGVESFFTDVVAFDPGSTDPTRFEYRYHLWKVPSPATPAQLGAAHGAKLISTRAQPVRGNPNLLRFVIPKTEENVKEGKNYYVVVTIQFYRRMWNVDPDLDPNDEKAIQKAMEFVYQDLNPPPPSVQQAADIQHTVVGNAFQNLFTFVPKTATIELDALRRSRSELQFQLATNVRNQWAQFSSDTARWNQTALASAARAQMVDDEIRKLEREIVNLRNARAQALELTKVANHRDILIGVKQYLKDPANAAKGTDALLAEIRDVSKNPGRTFQLLLEGGGPGARDAFEKFVLDQATAVTLEEGFQSASRGVTAMELGRKQLQVAKTLAESSGTPIGVTIDPIEVPWAKPPRRIEFPSVVPTDPSDAAYKAFVEQLDFERGLTESVRDGLETRIRFFGTVLKNSRDAFQRTFLQPNEALATELAKNIELTRAKHAEALRQKHNLLALETELAEQRELIEATESRLRQTSNVVLGIDANVNETAGTIQRKADLLVQERRFSTGKVASIAGETFGVLTDVGAAAWEARDKILVLRSKPSSVIVVEVRNGEVVHTAALGQEVGGAEPMFDVASLTRPLEMHPALPDGPALPFAVRAFFPGTALPSMRTPLVLDDSGAVAGAPRFGSLRFRRELEADRRAGVAPAPVQFQGSAGFPAQFETDRAAVEFLAILHGTGPQGPNGKGGFLVRDYPYTEPEALLVDAGFPSDVMALDSTGAAYLVNGNSTLQYGGRIFKYSGSPMVREHVGSVSYYSLDLQYARPTQPIAMEAAEGWTSAYGLVEDLFVAERDPGVYINAGIEGANRILRVAIHQTTRLPFYANGQNRNRLVGQPYAEHPDFRFTGPSDLETDGRRRSTDPLVPKNLYLSDEENIFVIRDLDKNGVGEVEKIASVPGRRFSGLEVDSNGNLLFADFETGELYVLPDAALEAILNGSVSPLSSDAELDHRAFLIRTGLASPGDVELDTWEQRILVSTQRGYEAMNVPLVGRLSGDIVGMHVDVIGREVPVTRRADRGNIFFAGTGSEGSYAKIIRIRVTRRDDETQALSTTSSTYNTVPLGVTVLPGEF